MCTYVLVVAHPFGMVYETTVVSVGQGLFGSKVVVIVQGPFAVFGTLVNDVGLGAGTVFGASL